MFTLTRRRIGREKTIYEKKGFKCLIKLPIFYLTLSVVLPDMLLTLISVKYSYYY